MFSIKLFYNFQNRNKQKFYQIKAQSQIYNRLKPHIIVVQISTCLDDAVKLNRNNLFKMFLQKKIRNILPTSLKVIKQFI